MDLLYSLAKICHKNGDKYDLLEEVVDIRVDMACSNVWFSVSFGSTAHLLLLLLLLGGDYLRSPPRLPRLSLP